VKVNLLACPLRLTYQTNVRGIRPGWQVTRDVWLVEVRVLGVDWEPWLLLTDWPVEDAPSVQCASLRCIGNVEVCRTVSNS
jgi:hypothetical protein